MTDHARAVRRLYALALLPLSAGVLGGGIAWAQAHDPRVTDPGTLDASADPDLAELLADVDAARERLADLQDTLDARAEADAGPSVSGAGDRAAGTAPSSTSDGSVTAPAAPTEQVAPPVQVAPPRTHTTTRGSG